MAIFKTGCCHWSLRDLSFFYCMILYFGLFYKLRLRWLGNSRLRSRTLGSSQIFNNFYNMTFCNSNFLHMMFVHFWVTNTLHLRMSKESTPALKSLSSYCIRLIDERKSCRACVCGSNAIFFVVLAVLYTFCVVFLLDHRCVDFNLH